MSTTIGSIFRSLKSKTRFNILTFPSEPVSDSYWDLAEENIYIWTNDSLTYDPKFLPALPTKIVDGRLPINVSFDLIVAHTAKSLELALRLSRYLHVPVCYWYHLIEGRMPAHYYIFSSTQIRQAVGGIGPVFGAFIDKPDKIDGHRLLCREEFIPTLTQVISPENLEPLEMNFIKRQQQYHYAAGIINIDKDIYLPELDECQEICPVFSVPTPYHKAINFTNSEELIKLITARMAYKPNPIALSSHFYSMNLHTMLQNMEGTAFEPV